MGFDIFMNEEPREIGTDYEPQFEEDPRYWRFVSVGMRGMLELMHKAGVIDTNLSSPEFPWPPEGFAEERVAEIEEWVFQDSEPEAEPTDDEKKVLRPLRKQVAQIRGTRSRNPELVPAFKFQTNDGWIIDEEECLLIADALRDAVARSRKFMGLFSSFLPSKEETGISKKEAAEWILNWAAYNELASRHGGYKVL